MKLPAAKHERPTGYDLELLQTPLCTKIFEEVCNKTEKDSNKFSFKCVGGGIHLGREMDWVWIYQLCPFNIPKSFKTETLLRYYKYSPNFYLFL